MQAKIKLLGFRRSIREDIILTRLAHTLSCVCTPDEQIVRAGPNITCIVQVMMIASPLCPGKQSRHARPDGR